MGLLQSLADAFKGRPGRVPLARSYGSPWFFADGLGGPAPYEYSASVRRGYLENPVAHRAVRLLAEGIGGAPLMPADAGLLALVRATCAGQAILETVTSQVLLHGNAYVQILKDAEGQPVELFALRPERVTMLAGGDGWPVALTYRVGEEVLNLPLIDGDASPNVIHIRGFHPGDDLYGAGCLNPADMAIAVHNAASAWNRSLLENAARPSGALIYDNAASGGLSGEQFARLKEELATAFSGAMNAGRPLLLGLPGDATYSNYREANRALWRLTILPMATKILAALGEGLATWFPAEGLAVDLDKVPALAEDRQALWAQVSGAAFLSEAEKRAMLGLPARAAADDLAVLAADGAIAARGVDDGL